MSISGGILFAILGSGEAQPFVEVSDECDEEYERIEKGEEKRTSPPNEVKNDIEK